MASLRIALANLPFPATPSQSVALAEAARAHAQIICFPECYLPGYRARDKPMPPPDPAFLAHAHATLARAAARANITVILGTERVIQNTLRATALVINPNGTLAGFQDKVQLDPSEDSLYSLGTHRQIFHAGPLTFGIVICHEGRRYPETGRWAALRGAHIVFHPHFLEAEPGSYQPTTFAHPANTFHEKAALCRASENTCYFATVNYASPGSPTTSAVVHPNGTLLTHQPYGQPGLLLAELDLAPATGLLAHRTKSIAD